MIGAIGSFSACQIAGAVASKVEQYADSQSNQGRLDAQGDSAQTSVSILARQLAASASRAEERDKALTRSEMTDKAKTALNQIQGDSYFANKAKHDSEVPKTNDPELLARAKQATAYVNSAARGGSLEKNPFAGLSREQLASIVYDDSGTFTVNERRAAAYEADRQEEAWRVQVAAQAMAEYNSTGKLTNFFRSLLAYFKELPVIEQVQYPQGYGSDLEGKIKLDFNYQMHQAGNEEEDPVSLIEALLKKNLH